MITIQLVGDMYLPGVFPKSALTGVADQIRSADLTIGNLEMPMCDELPPLRGKPEGAVTEHHSDPKSARVLAECGFGAFSLANNHAMNYGWSGLAETVRALEEAGLGHAGAGATREEAHRPAVADADGTRVAILSYTTVYARGLFEATDTSGGVAVIQVDTLYRPPPRYFEVPGLPATVHTVISPAHLDRVRRDIVAARKSADAVVVCLHWGRSGKDSVFLEYQSEIAHAAVDAGADIVVGTHPHRLQPLEIYRGRPIFYSLGNFCYAQPIGFFRRESCIAEVDVSTGNVAGIRVRPIWIDEDYHPVILELSDQRSADVARSLDVDARADANGDARFFELTAQMWAEPV